MLELIVQNHEEAVEAEKLGATRLELVSAISEGGLTPSYGTMKKVFESVSIPVFTMIRPHSFRFVYSEEDAEIIEQDILQLLSLGQHRIVFGALLADGSIDEKLLKRVIQLSPKLEITFHRAFDETKDQIEAYKILAKYPQVKWLLTSGGSENCLAGKEQLRKLVELSRELDGPTIMPGAGLSEDNISEIHEYVQAKLYHFGSAVRMDRSFAKGFDRKKVEEIIKKLK